MSGKWFADSFEDAIVFGQKMGHGIDPIGAELNMNLHEGVFCNYDEEEKEYLPDFSLTVIMAADSEKKEGEWLYYEQDGFEITLANYQNGKMAMEAISELSCFICIPDDEPETE